MAGLYLVLIPDQMVGVLDSVSIKIAEKDVKIEEDSYQGVAFSGDEGIFDVFSNELWFFISELNDHLLILP